MIFVRAMFDKFPAMTVDATTTGQMETILGDFWDENAIAIEPSDATDTGDYVAPLDSMSAVEVLIKLEELLGEELEASDIIRQGGYDSRDQFISDISARVLSCLRKEVT
jgi:acyl carrier protein